MKKENYICSECNSKIEYGMKNCPKCKRELLWDDSNNAIQDTYNSFMKMSKVLPAILIILSFASLIPVIIYAIEEEDLGVFAIAVVGSILLIISSTLIKINLKYKAFTLLSIHEINNKINK